MNNSWRLSGFVAAVLMGAGLVQAGEPPVRGYGEWRPMPDRYIVVFKNNVARPDIEAANLVGRGGGHLHFTYSNAIRGFAATLPEAAIKALARNPNVAYVEQDQTIELNATQSNPTWGLDRIDQRNLPLNGSYLYNYTGAGVYAFIIDTGIRASHSEFAGGRVQTSLGFTAINDGRGTGDCNGHGTHVAGTVGGTVYGVAKQVTLVPVRVLNCQGSGTTSGVIAGVDHVASSNVRPAVANMSLGGGASSSLDSAVANAVSKGVTMVVAAGNSNANACNYSPARAASAITVGATTSSDARASYSNFGTCLDLFAPGSSITSAWYNSNTATNTISGTSMAAPHVAGVAALALQFNSVRSPSEVVNLITAGATTGKVTSAGSGSPNRLLYSLLDGGSGGEINQPPTASFTFSCTDLACSFDGSGSSDSDGTISGYSWNFGDGTSGVGATVAKTYSSGGTRTVTLTVTDDDGATGSQSQSVTTTAPGGGGGASLNGSSSNNGGSWTAIVTLSGSVGASTSGNWSTGPSGGCSITSAPSCSFSLGGIPKRTGSVTYTDGGSLGSVTINKP